VDWLSDQRVRRLLEVADRPDFTETRYELLNEIARGGMGVVYLARDTRLDRDVAVKVLNTSEMTPVMIERMRREAYIIARLEHPGIVPVHDLGTLPDGRIYYVMKYVRGKRLDEYVDSSLSLNDRLRLFRTACEAVAFAHAHKVVHRDLKPENIMVGPFGEVLVMDWGIAKYLTREQPETCASQSQSDEVVTGHGTVLGTREFMSPEQASGNVDVVDERSDVYSLGAILKDLIFTFPAPATTRVSRRLAAIVRCAMADSPESRYASAEDLALDIDRFIDGQPVTAYRETGFEQVARWALKHRVLLILILTYLLLRAVLIIISAR
jgi:eukaryotic-like serine/threonine-protein kinase